MPIYEYRCEKCEKVFEEVTLEMGPDKLSTTCTNRTETGLCGGVATKIISKGSFIVHGYNSNNGYAGNMR